MEALIGWPFPEAPLTCGTEDGIAWATCPGPFEASINGYAQIPAEHPWAHVDAYYELDVDVHGGLTFGPEPGSRSLASIGGWIGFDTMHLHDRWELDELRAAGLDPDEEHVALMSQLHLHVADFPPVTLRYVEDQARGLAAQIAAARSSVRWVGDWLEASDDE